jgi:hypothetical protein
MSIDCWRQHSLWSTRSAPSSNERGTFRRDIGRVIGRSRAAILAFELDVDPIAADTCGRISVSQQDGLSWFKSM